jgi:hypothetical protein
MTYQGELSLNLGEVAESQLLEVVELNESIWYQGEGGTSNNDCRENSLINSISRKQSWVARAPTAAVKT